VVGIDQQNEALRMRAREMLECEDFVVMRLHKGVRHRAVNRDAECDPSGYRDGTAKASDITRPCGEHPRLGAMHSSQTIINERSPWGGDHHARRF